MRVVERREATIKFLRGPATRLLSRRVARRSDTGREWSPRGRGIVAVLAVPVFVLSYRRWLGGRVPTSVHDEDTVTRRGVHPLRSSQLTTPRASEGADHR